METDSQATAMPAVRCDEWLWRVRLEWNAADLWVGIYWSRDIDPLVHDQPNYLERLDVWVCLVPCVPIHVAVRWQPQRHNAKLTQPRHE